MIIIGERLNSSRKSVLEARQCRDREFVCGQAKIQEEAGVSYVDLNTAALMDGEIEALLWAIPLLQCELSVPLSFDTPNPRAVDVSSGALFLDSVEKIKREMPHVKTIAGLSNVSFGMPQRCLLNRTFLALAMTRGLDAAICDPLDGEIQATIHAAAAERMFWPKLETEYQEEIEGIAAGLCARLPRSSYGRVDITALTGWIELA